MSSFYDNISEYRERIHTLSNINLNAICTCSLNENVGQSSHYYAFPEVSSHSLLENELECLDRLEDCIIPLVDKMEPMIKKAECINPIGLTVRCMEPCEPIDTSDRNAEVIAALKSCDNDRINDCIEKIANPTDFFSDSLLDMKACTLGSIKESKSTKKAEKSDIEKAMKMFKDERKKIANLKKKAAEKSQDKKYKVKNLKEEIEKSARVVLHDDNEEEKCSKVSECCLAAICIENEDFYNYIDAVKERMRFLNEMKTAINTISKVSVYNPRDIKHTMHFAEMVGDIMDDKFDNIVRDAVE